MGCRCPRSVPWALHIFSPPWAPWCPLVGSSPPVPTRGHHCPLMGWISMVPIFDHLWARWCPLVPAWAPAVWCPRNGHQKSGARRADNLWAPGKLARRAHNGHQPNLVTRCSPPCRFRHFNRLQRHWHSESLVVLIKFSSWLPSFQPMVPVAAVTGGTGVLTPPVNHQAAAPGRP